ncbi:MAG TPA: response regulator transcription factor [Candidatus Wallbacteria bacterium]|nr:response regulator transcription factor [Candidatus Wallbacteria bacterium]
MNEEYSKTKILLVEDDEALANGLKEALKLENIEVVTAGSAGEAGRVITESGLSGFDIMVLDLTLPDGSGLDILKKVRRESLDFAVIILSARSSELDKVVGLELGADDYMCKPFSLKELHARIKALIRRSKRSAGKDAPDIFRHENLSVNLGSREVFIKDKAAKLSFTEFEILKLLLLNKNIVVERQTLIERVWNGIFIDLRSVDPHISRLRKKIAPYGALIETLPNIGYKFKI